MCPLESGCEKTLWGGPRRVVSPQLPLAGEMRSAGDAHSHVDERDLRRPFGDSAHSAREGRVSARLTPHPNEARAH